MPRRGPIVPRPLRAALLGAALCAAPVTRGAPPKAHGPPPPVRLRAPTASMSAHTPSPPPRPAARASSKIPPSTAHARPIYSPSGTALRAPAPPGSSRGKSAAGVLGGPARYDARKGARLGGTVMTPRRR